jgi:hypothetical protein
MTTPLFVYIIESPSAEDLLEGRAEGRALSEVLALAGIPYSYNLVTNLETWNIALGSRLQDADNCYPGRVPILHLSLHGNERGVALTDDTVFLWNQLKKELTPLNNKMEGSLLICMSSCFGAYGRRMARDNSTDNPFYALVGSSNKVSWPDAAVAYVTFYHLLFKGISIDECVEKMKLASHNNDFGVWRGSEIKDTWQRIIEIVRQNKIRSNNPKSWTNSLLKN